jgi:hypothetical protein
MIMRMVWSLSLRKEPRKLRLWKNECAPLMMSQPITEQLIRSRDNTGEFISLSTWTRIRRTWIGIEQGWPIKRSSSAFTRC